MKDLRSADRVYCKEPARETLAKLLHSGNTQRISEKLKKTAVAVFKENAFPNSGPIFLQTMAIPEKMPKAWQE